MSVFSCGVQGGGGLKPVEVYLSTSANLQLTNVQIGAASGQRRVFVFYSYAEQFSSGDITSMTIGGVTATRNLFYQNGSVFIGVYSAIVPSGTTATISYTAGGVSNLTSLRAISVYNLRESSPIDAKASRTVGTSATVNMNTNTADSILLAMGVNNANVSINRVNNTDIDGSTIIGYNLEPVRQTSLSLTVTGTDTSYSSIIGVTWR